MQDKREIKTEAHKPELIISIAKNITKVRDYGVADTRFQVLDGFSLTVWIQKHPVIAFAFVSVFVFFFGSSVFVDTKQI